MKVLLREPLSFIRKEGLKDFYLENRTGAMMIVDGTFSQNIKQSELQQILSLNTIQEPVPEKPKTAKQLKEEAKAAEEAERKAKEEQAKADEAKILEEENKSPAEGSTKVSEKL